MMPFVENAWYVATWSDALIQATPIARTVIGRLLVLFRTEDGVAVAMEDRCAHRLAPLSRGRVEGDRIVCGYHGLQFGIDGHCIHNPHGGKLPRQAKIRTFPVVEKHAAVWVWMGTKPADASLIPDFSILDGDHGLAGMRRDHMVMNGPWDLITDNLLDLSHVNFLHEGILGNVEMIDTPNMVDEDGETVTVTRRCRSVTPPGMFDMLYRQDGEPVDAWMSMRWNAPAAMLLDVGVKPVDGPRDDGTGYFGIHILTPETERTTHYHFAAVRWNVRPDSETVEIKEKVSDMRRYAFAEQDMPMISAQAHVWEMAGPDHGRPVWLDIDVGIARWRRIVDRHLQEDGRIAA